MPYLTIKNTRIYYEEYNPEENSDVLLLIHGAAQDTLSWRYNIDSLSEKFHLIIIDLPGHGKSQLAEKEAIDDLEVFATYTEEFMKMKNIEKYSVMGHSMAGGIALYMALHDRSTLNFICIVDGACYTSGTYGDETFDLVALNSTDWFEMNFRAICSEHTPSERVEEIAFDVRRCAPEVAFNDIKAYSKLNLVEKMPEIDTPIMILHGEDDWSIPSELGIKTAEMSNGETVVKVLKNNGHFPHTENPEVFNNSFYQALSELKVAFQK